MTQHVAGQDLIEELRGTWPNDPKRCEQILDELRDLLPQMYAAASFEQKPGDTGEQA